MLNGRYYIGRHATKNINDNYMGSGKAIINAIKKYGKDAFTKEILCEVSSTEELWELEKKIVNDTVINDPLSYNMSYGGKSYLDGLKKYNPKKFLQHQSNAGKIGGVAVRKTKTPEQLKNWHSLGGKTNAKKQKILKVHPFYNGEAAILGGKAIKGMLELWNPKATATNKNQKEYKSGDSTRVKPDSPKYLKLVEQGWLTIDQHKKKIQSVVILCY
jgi:hypothetical protein